jgi:hypothetical protein
MEAFAPVLFLSFVAGCRPAFSKSTWPYFQACLWAFLMGLGLVFTVLGPRPVLSGEDPLLKDFFIHYWWGPPTTPDLDAKYADVARCGFNFAGIPGEGEMASREKSQAVLDACQRNRLQYLLSDVRVNPRLAAKKPEDPEFYASLDAAIADYASHPAFAGFHVVDEPSASIFPWLAKINEYLLQKLPDKLPFMNLLPNWAPAWLLAHPTPDENPGGNPVVITYEDYLEQFITIVKPKMLSYDNYAFLEGVPERFDLYFANFEIIREKGLKYQIPTCFVLVSQGQPRPTGTDLLWQVNMALVYGFKGLSYFTYWVWGEKPLAITYQDCLPTDKYNEVKRINGQVRRWAPTLMKLTSTGVYHTVDVPRGCQPVDPGLPLQIHSDRPAVLGMFRHEGGSTWVMIVNRDYEKPTEVRVTFDGSVATVEELSAQTGVSKPVQLSQGSTTFPLDPAECQLFKLVIRSKKSF